MNSTQLANELGINCGHIDMVIQMIADEIDKNNTLESFKNDPVETFMAYFDQVTNKLRNIEQIYATTPSAHDAFNLYILTLVKDEN